MSREEARFNLDISSDTAKQVQERGRDSQKSRGVLPSSGNLDEMKLAGPVEEELMTKAGRESQKRKEEKNHPRSNPTQTAVRGSRSTGQKEDFPAFSAGIFGGYEEEALTQFSEVKLNGRQIKNVVKIAHNVAMSENTGTLFYGYPGSVIAAHKSTQLLSLDINRSSLQGFTKRPPY
uniref:Uncharacterized protein n=1 Tax=Talaromyces marneffei PM1 TaxID=1077442 RepID=A0A093VPX0_TALMA